VPCVKPRARNSPRTAPGSPIDNYCLYLRQDGHHDLVKPLLDNTRRCRLEHGSKRASAQARIVKDTPGALAWAHSIGALVKKRTGNEIEVLVRVGATRDVVWLQRFSDLASYGK
jgi:hypothetical protein